jgi:hypothetical protein
VPDYLSRKAAADYIKARGLFCTPGSLTKFAHKGDGPIYQIFGSRAVYTPKNLDAWIDQKLSPPRRSTSDARDA